LYTLLFIAVLKELEGLARGGKDRDYVPVPPVDPEHAAKVAEAAKMALVFLRSRSPGVRCVTTRGTVIHTSAFAMEEDTEQVVLFTKLGEVESWFMSDILQVQ
jgi:protein SMG6